MTNTTTAPATPAPTPPPQAGDVAIVFPPADLGPATMKQQRFIPLALIHPSPFNPRKEFDDASIAELAESIRVNGLKQNLNVRPHPKIKEHYELTGGERRWRALKLLKAEGAICKIEEATDATSIAVQLIENLQREDVAPMDEAKGFVALQKLDPVKWTPLNIAAAIGMSKRFVLQRLSLATSLIPKARKMLEDGEINVEKARVLSGAPKHVQEELVDDWQLDEYSVKDLRGHILESLVPSDRAAFPLDLYKGGWHEEGKKKYFTDVEQFNKLQQAAAVMKRDELRKAGWPKAEIIDADKRHGYKWADTGDGLSWSGRSGTKAHGKLKVPQEKCTALVWIDNSAKLCHAEGVAAVSLFPAERSSYSGGGSTGMPARESAGQRRSRFDFNERLVKACADKADTGLRMALVALVGTYGARFTYDSGHTSRAEKAVLPEALLKIAQGGGYSSGDRSARTWAIVKTMKIEEVQRCIAGYAATAFMWDSQDGKKPKGFAATLGELLKVAPREIDPPGKAKTDGLMKATQKDVDKAFAKIKAAAKPKAKAKAKGKKKQ